MGSMMHMPWVLVMIIAFVVIVGGGVFAIVRVVGARATGLDHPRPGQPSSRARQAVEPDEPRGRLDG